MNILDLFYIEAMVAYLVLSNLFNMLENDFKNMIAMILLAISLAHWFLRKNVACIIRTHTLYTNTCIYFNLQ